MEGHVTVVMHCLVGVDAERLDVICQSYLRCFQLSIYGISISRYYSYFTYPGYGLGEDVA